MKFRQIASAKHLHSAYVSRLAKIALSVCVFSVTVPVFTAEEAKSNGILVQNLRPQEISLRAKQFTVRIDGASTGTGIIIDEADNSYTVLTNWHVVQQPGDYSIKTIDGREHSIDYGTVRQLPNLDLAILRFNSQQNYQLAETGSSASLNEGENIYFAGYPGELRSENNRYYRFFPTNLASILLEPTANGYSLVYGGEPLPGMSGGPVLNEQGLLVGVHGETNIHAVTQGTSNYAIPIDRYQTAIANIDQSVATENPDSPSPQPSENTAVDTTPSTATVEANPEPADVEAENTEAATEPLNTAADTPNTVTVETINPEPADVEAENTEAATEPSNTAADTSTETESAQELVNIDSVPVLSSTTSSKPKLEAEEPVDINVDEVEQPSEVPKKPQLLSMVTGIDYTPLKKSLEAGKWQEADRQTQQLITRIIDTAKRKNRNLFITVNDIADYSCTDMTTIDRLWQEYSQEQFGLSPQRNLWLTILEENGFSTDTWRGFATKLGWKEGEVSNAGGYLLYEQLTFDPAQAPKGHLPWWFAASKEEQDIIKSAFNRCSLDLEESEAETETTDQSPTQEKPQTPVE